MINLITSQRDEIFSKNMENVLIPGLYHNFKKSNKNGKNLSGKIIYHWESKKKLKRDLKNIYLIYDKILNILFKRLNLIHNKKFSKRYWEVLIWVWLYRFIIYYYDRWETVYNLKKNFKNKKILCKHVRFREKDFIPRDTQDWCTTSVMTDDWNHWVYSKIIEKNSTIKSIFINKLKKKPKKVFNYQKFFQKNLVKSILNIFLKFFQNKKIFAQNLSFSNKAPFRLKFFFKKMNSIDQDIFWSFKQNIKINERNFLSQKENSLNSSFEKFLVSQIKYNFPTIFLENYKKGLSKIDRQKLPTKPKLIITSLDDMFNEPFKFYVAKNIMNDTKLFHLQHGGSYGLSDDYPVEKMQIKLSDKFFSWGWQDKSNKIIPNFCQKTLGINIRQTKQSKGLLIPIFEFSLYPGHIAGGRPRTIYEIDRYIKNLKVFFSSLRDDIKEDSAFKYLDLKKIYPNYVLESLKSKFKKTVFFSSKKQACLFLKKYKLNIETVNSTGYLESLNLNLPTIVIFDKSYCGIRKKSLKYFKLLKEAKILFYDPNEAARFVNKNYNNIDEWWNSKKVQVSVKKFVNKFARSTDNPYTFLEKLKIQIQKN